MIRIVIVYIFIVFSLNNSLNSQVVNYVENGSFEKIKLCDASTLPNSWLGLDSAFCCIYFSKCLGNVPLNGFHYQKPKSGNSYVGINIFYPSAPGLERQYMRNRLKQRLVAGKTYCVKLYVNISDNSTVGVDGFGAYFGDNTIDTIKKTTVPLTYLTPQVQNPNNNLITDTLNWTLITGTFTAQGNEKFMLIGNFKSDAATNTVLINPTGLPSIATDVCVDDVSCIEMDAPAYAGPDKNILSGQSTYLGRELDFAVDPYCYWYQLPGMVPLDTASGITVSPTVTTTYVVRQELECNSIKWDTVVVRVGYTGLAELSGKWLELSVYPNPAYDFIELKIEDEKLKIENCVCEIINSLGQLVKEQELIITDGKARVNTKDLESGVYVMRIRLSANYFSTSLRQAQDKLLEVTGTISKRFVVNH